jgi:hypothetical protein
MIFNGDGVGEGALPGAVDWLGYRYLLLAVYYLLLAMPSNRLSCFFVSCGKSEPSTQWTYSLVSLTTGLCACRMTSKPFLPFEFQAEFWNMNLSKAIATSQFVYEL